MDFTGYYNVKFIENSQMDLVSRLRAVGKTYFGNVIDDRQLNYLEENIKTLVGKNCSCIIDLGCGTGVNLEILSLSNCAASYIGVDLNENFIKLCTRYFEIVGIENVDFRVGSLNVISDFEMLDACIFSYEVVQHIEPKDLINMTSIAKHRGASKFIIGGVPDLDRRELFYKDRDYTPLLSDGCDDVIGFWYTGDFFERLAGKLQCGIKIKNQGKLYTSHYRFDVEINF